MPALPEPHLDPRAADVPSRPRSLYATGLKRGFDCVAAVGLIVVLLPVFLLVAACVAVAMGRPVLFRDRRAGLDGQPFTVLKFRSMRDAADADGEPLPDAQRLTAFGRLLRRTSLDELPQLLCVVQGSMSMVGPRPLPERYLPRYSARQATRLFVRPGLTGWAQTHGRNAVGWEDRLSLDADYVDRLGRPLGILLDARIVAATIGLVLYQAITGRGVAAPGEATMQEFLGTAGEGERGA
jgi:sugar transferase EpsL